MKNIRSTFVWSKKQFVKSEGFVWCLGFISDVKIEVSTVKPLLSGPPINQTPSISLYILCVLF